MYEKIKAAQVKYKMDVGVALGKFYLTRLVLSSPLLPVATSWSQRLRKLLIPITSPILPESWRYQP
jgi:hypothetical protein